MNGEKEQWKKSISSQFESCALSTKVDAHDFKNARAGVPMLLGDLPSFKIYFLNLILNYS